MDTFKYALRIYEFSMSILGLEQIGKVLLWISKKNITSYLCSVFLSSSLCTARG